MAASDAVELEFDAQTSLFQYPFVGSNGCITVDAAAYEAADDAFSIPSSDRMAASQVQRPAHRGRAEPFQYPFVGSNGCIRPGSALQSGAAHAAFQYPFVASNGCIARLGQRPDRISRGFQYPFVGSNGCIAARPVAR